jgi:nucleoside 2-deoxyribosyltransferase
MGRLAGMKLYCAGPMQYTSDEHSWRDLVTDRLEKYGVEVLNPAARSRFAVESKDIRERMNKEIEAGNYDAVRQEGKLIRNADLRWVDLSDFIVVYLDLQIPTVGTWEELFLANRSKKPVLVVLKQTKSKTPLWLMWTLPHQHIFSSFDELFDYLEYIDSSDEIQNVGFRWVFNYETV